MAKQNLSKKGVSRFLKKTAPKNERKRKQPPGGALGTQQRPGSGGLSGRAPPPRRSKHAGERRNHGVRKKKGGSGSLPQGYSTAQRILLVGEGNLSMARALLRLFDGEGANLVATTFDTAESLQEKYAETVEILEELSAAGVVTGFGVDATNLRKDLAALRKRRRREAAAPADAAAPAAPAAAADDDDADEDMDAEAPAAGASQQPLPPLPPLFDRVVFNFPHRALGIKDQDANVRANQELLLGFFRSALEVLAPGGEILVTLKSGMPYALWNAPKLASQGTGNVLALRTALPFDALAFPGYAHRRTHGDGVSRPNAEELAGGARTYVWRRSIEEAVAA